MNNGTSCIPKKITVATTQNGPYYELPAMDGSLTSGADAIDVTTFANTGSGGNRSRVLGLQDWSVSCSCQVATSGDAQTALTTVLNAMTNRSELWVKYLGNGTDGLGGQVVCESYNQSAGVADTETIEISLQANGALGVVSA